MKTFYRYFWVLLTLFILLAACGENEYGDIEGWDEDESLVGIPFLNGVECLGEEAEPITGDEVYVSPEGDDTNSGGSVEEPFGTLAHAICNLIPGQTLYVLPGTYYESVILGAFGDDGAPIMIKGVVEDGKYPVLDGEGKRTLGIALVESQNFVIEGLEFRNYSESGVRILVGSDFIVRDTLFVDNGRTSIDPDSDGEGFGIDIDGVKNVLIEDSEFSGNGPNQERWENFTLGMGINTYEIENSIIRNNYVHDTIGGGILVEDSQNVLVENNRIEDNELDANGDYWDGGIWVDGGRNITLRGNTITGNHGPGLNLSDEDVQYPSASTGYIVEGNIVTGNLFGAYTWNFGVCPVPSDAILFNDNQIEGNQEKDMWCEEWTCGEGEACD